MINALAQLHENKKLVAVAQTAPGRIAIWMIAALLLDWLDVSWLVVAALALVMLAPGRRRLILSLAAAATLFALFLDRPDIQVRFETLSLSTLLSPQFAKVLLKTIIVLAFLYLAYYTARNLAKLPAFVRRLPIVGVHVGIWLALIMSSIAGTGLFGLGPFLAWRLSYLFSQASSGKMALTSFKDHLFYLMPVFGGTSTPYGKGLDFLARHECAEAASAARSQLAGVKLLVLAIFWLFALRLMDAAVFGQPDVLFSSRVADWRLDVPRLADLMLSGPDSSVPLAWASVFLELIRITLVLAATGHVIVGCVRLLGFNIYRNTYKPLLAETIVEFWSRFYFYFKELLVDFFFYPAFLSCSWAGQKLRLFIAVFAAAFAGNLYFHFLLRYEAAISLDVTSLWNELGPRLVYCGLLAVGIWISMLRQQKKRLDHGGVHTLLRLRRIAGVWTFFGLINIWNIGPAELGMIERLEFTKSLFFLQ